MGQFDEVLNEEISRYGQKRARAELSVKALRVPLGDLDVGPCETVTGDEVVAECARRIAQPRTSCVLVTGDDGTLVGLVTDRDLCARVLAQGLDPNNTRVEQIMTRKPVALRADDPLAYALSQMDVGGYRHIPLVDADGRPTGVLTARRIIHYIVEFFPEEVKVLPPRPVREGPTERHGA